MKQVSRALALAFLGATALPLAACTTSTPASVPGLTLAVGDSLPGAQGKTVADQDKIDDTVAGSCATGVYSKAACRRHTTASAERRRELRAPAGVPIS